jgi:RNA 3'-terminal phosphate cyclase (ATP)
MIVDGSYGEGGGQIVRTAVSLSVVTGKPIQIINIRSKRNNPGLRPQHLSAVKAVADLFHAKVENLKVGADWIRFIPSSYSHFTGRINHFDSCFKDKNADYFLNNHSKPSESFDYSRSKIDIGTAGSIANVLLTIIPAISVSGVNHTVQIIGGTDVKHGPTIDYLRYVVREIYAGIGINFDIDVIQRGYYPKGGGIVNAQIKAINQPMGKSLTISELFNQTDDTNGTIINNNNNNNNNDTSRIQESIRKVPFAAAAAATTSIIKSPLPGLMKIKIVSVCSKQLPKHVAERQLSAAISNLEKNGVHTFDEISFKTSCENSLSPGSSILIFSTSRNDNNRSDGWYIGGDSIGERGKRAEIVGIEASRMFLENYLKNIPIDYLLADMLVAPLSLIKGRHRFRVGKVTEHLKTNLYVVNSMVDGCKCYINDASLSRTATTNPILEGDIVADDGHSRGTSFVINIESAGRDQGIN